MSRYEFTYVISGEGDTEQDALSDALEAFDADRGDPTSTVRLGLTEDQIADMAEASAFYVTPEGKWLRMQYVLRSEGRFCALDEESGEEYLITFEEVTEELDPHFERITRVKVPV